MKKSVNIWNNAIICAMLIGLMAIALPNAVTSTAAYKQGVHYSGNPNNKQTSLMVNVYWGTEYIESMLATFARHGVKTTFFIGGMWANKEPEMLKKIVAEGHEIGNHGYLHVDHDKVTKGRQRQEILTTHDLVKSLTGIEMTLFAPPSGAFNAETLEVAEELGYKTIMWSSDTVDWKYKDKEQVYKRATNKIINGGQVLMHPTAHTAAALENIINHYVSKGYNLTTVSQNIAP